MTDEGGGGIDPPDLPNGVHPQAEKQSNRQQETSQRLLRVGRVISTDNRSDTFHHSKEVLALVTLSGYTSCSVLLHVSPI